MRVLVTGIGGFVGPVMAAALLERGHEVHGLTHGPLNPRLDVLGVARHPGDLLDPGSFDRVVAAVVPDAVLHLAALSFVPAAEADPPLAYRTNVGGTLAVLAAVRARASHARLLVVGSADAYGLVTPADLPIVEETPFRPVTVYGATKAAVDVTAAQWGRAYGLDVVRVRPFNHTGPGQAPSFVCSALARQVAAIEAGAQEPVLRVGNPDPVRDFSDVRDIVAGYVALLERGRRGEAYNLCHGEGVSIAEVIAILRTHARVPLRVWSDPALRRPVDAPRIVGSHARATTDTGWTPQIPLDETLRLLLEDWRTRLTTDPADATVPPTS
jgi:GDP-4-dehydro-6-deoxy-D-mannose reductase